MLELDLTFRVGYRAENNSNPDSLYTVLTCNDVDIPATDMDADESEY